MIGKAPRSATTFMRLSWAISATRAGSVLARSCISPLGTLYFATIRFLSRTDAIERVAFPDFVPPEPGAPDFAEGELAEAAE